ncbi:hypothetical protein ACWEFL_09415 [Streptomyces sp. NPDC004838]
MTEQLSRGKPGHDEIVAQVRESLQESGIDSFDAMVERLAASAPRLTHEDHLMMIENAAVEDQPPPPPHQPPEIMVVIDGETNEPETVREFDGQPLYSMPGLDDKGNEVLYMFTSLKRLRDHRLTAARHGDTGTTNPDSLSNVSHYYEHDDLGGDWLQNGPGRGWKNLKKVPRGFLGLGDWNDIISSVDWCRWDITLWDRPDWGGNRLEIPAGFTRFHLSKFGWNDCVSATANWGTRF